MLKRLIIQNFALIDHLDLEFLEGLTVITGETGAGKSIIVQAVAALLGETVNSESVKSGSGIARVEGLFDLPESLLLEPRFIAVDLDLEADGILRLTREIQREGRSRFLINDQVIRKTEFNWLGQQLLDINSQHSHQLLLKPRHHLELLDGALKVQEKLNAVGVAWRNWNMAVSAYQNLKKTVSDMEKRRQLIEYQMTEIDEAELQPGEKQELIDERERLRFADEIRQNLTEAGHILDDSPCMVTDHAARVASLIQRAMHRDSRLTGLAEQAESLALIARDISSELRRAASRIHTSPDRLNQIGERLFFLQQLEGKFRNDVEGILQYRQEIEEEFREYTSLRGDLDGQESECRTRAGEYLLADAQLSDFRRESAPVLCRRIETTLSDLGMPHTRFDVSFSQSRDLTGIPPGEIPDWCSDRGTDQLEFVFSANPGVPLKPVAQIASGGELSRVMMALKQHLSEALNYRTMVLDEVDSGIGGDVANAVGDRLRLLSRFQQILCVTHLPQIAVRGHHHILVEKYTDGSLTRIGMSNLEREHRIREIARMLSGDETVTAAVTHAALLLSGVRD